MEYAIYCIYNAIYKKIVLGRLLVHGKRQGVTQHQGELNQNQKRALWEISNLRSERYRMFGLE